MPTIIADIIRRFTSQPLPQKINRFLHNPKDRKLLAVIILSNMIFLFLTGFQEDSWIFPEYAVEVFIISFGSFGGFGAGVMIADAYNEKYKKILISASLIIIIATLLLAIFQFENAFTAFAGIILWPLCLAILLKNNILKILHGNIIQLFRKKRTIKITIHSG